MEISLHVASEHSKKLAQREIMKTEKATRSGVVKPIAA